MLRDVGRWHARDADGELALAEKAQELFKFLKQHRVTTADPYGALLEREVPALADGPLYRLVHDDLGEHWHPLWFADFAAHAGRHGLGYVGEADLYGLRSEMLPEGVVPELWQLAGGDRIAFENLSDLMTGRHFRQSLFGHAEKPADVDPAPERTARLHWAVRPSAEPLEVGLVADVFAVLDERRPRTLSFAELQERLGADPAALGEALLDGFRRERLIPHAGPLGIAERARRAPQGLVARALAGRPRARHHIARLHHRAHGGARRAAADHAARRDARPRGDPRRAARARRLGPQRGRPRQQPRRAHAPVPHGAVAPHGMTPRRSGGIP